jgi:hypothetical protein
MDRLFLAINFPYLTGLSPKKQILNDHDNALKTNVWRCRTNRFTA